MMLLLCGDISTNPGPVRDPCGECCKPVRANQDGLQCDGCDTWTHRACLNMTKQEYHRFGSSHENWFCRVCYLPQFTDSFFSAVDSNQSYLSNSSDNSLMTSFIEDNSRIDIAGETMIRRRPYKTLFRS